MSFPKATALTDALTLLEPAIRSAWVTNAGQDASRICWPNTDFEPPPVGFWLEPFYRFGDTFGFQLGPPGVGQNLKLGLIFLGIFGDKAAGTRSAYDIAQKVNTPFVDGFIGPIRVRVIEGPLDLTEEGRLHFQSAISFEYLEIK